MNPVYKTNIVPGDDKVCHLFLPKNKVADFIMNADSIYNYNKKADVASDGGEQIKQYVKVRKGETLKGVSLRVGVTVSDLKKWNNIKGTYIKAGRWLVYYKGGNGAETANNETTDNNENNNEVKNEPKNEVKNTPPPTPKSTTTTYTVKSGDTLYKIADRKNISATSIKKANPNVNWNRLQIGQKIKIPSR
jgi:LysM repeat protein